MDHKKLLIAFDGSENSFRAVDYVADLVGAEGGFSVTLLHVERLPDKDMFPDEDAWHQRCQTQEQEAREALERATARLAESGLTADAQYLSGPDRTTPAMGASVVQDILARQREGGYGTIVLGRRGMSKQEEFLFGSISNKLIHDAQLCTVWVVQ